MTVWQERNQGFNSLTGYFLGDKKLEPGTVLVKYRSNILYDDNRWALKVIAGSKIATSAHVPDSLNPNPVKPTAPETINVLESNIDSSEVAKMFGVYYLPDGQPPRRQSLLARNFSHLIRSSTSS